MAPRKNFFWKLELMSKRSAEQLHQASHSKKFNGVYKMSAKQKASKSNPKQARGQKLVVSKSSSSPDHLQDDLFAAGLLIPGEDAEDVGDFIAKTIHQLKPIGHLEEAVSQDIAIALWRLKRIPAFEAAVVSARDTATADKSPANQNKEERDHLAEMASRYLPCKRDQSPSEEESAPVLPGKTGKRRKTRTRKARKPWTSILRRRSAVLSYMTAKTATSSVKC